jgi:hypothetical protein
VPRLGGLRDLAALHLDRRHVLGVFGRGARRGDVEDAAHVEPRRIAELVHLRERFDGDAVAPRDPEGGLTVGDRVLPDELRRTDARSARGPRRRRRRTRGEREGSDEAEPEHGAIERGHHGHRACAARGAPVCDRGSARRSGFARPPRRITARRRGRSRGHRPGGIAASSVEPSTSRRSRPRDSARPFVRSIVSGVTEMTPRPTALQSLPSRSRG